MHDEYHRKQQTRLPRMEPASRQHSISIRHVRSPSVPPPIPISSNPGIESDPPHIITLMLQNQQHHTPHRRQRQIRQASLDVHPQPQPRLKHVHLRSSPFFLTSPTRAGSMVFITAGVALERRGLPAWRRAACGVAGGPR